MAVPDLPMPDGVVKNLLIAVFGSSSVVVVGFVAANFVVTWLDTLKKGAETARKVGRASLRLMDLPRFAVAVGVAVTVAILLLQVVWLWASYLVGNGLAYMFVGRSGMTNGPDWNEFMTSLRWDWISELYVLIGLAVLAYAYATVARGEPEQARRFAWLLLAPLVPIGALTALGSLLGGLDYLLYSINADGRPEIRVDAKHFALQCLAITAMAVIYAIATDRVLSTPGVIARIWRPPRNPDGSALPAIGQPRELPIPHASRRNRFGLVIGLTVLIVVGFAVKDHMDKSRQQAAVATAQYATERAALEKTLKAALVDCFVTLEDGNDTESAVDKNKHYPCGRIPLQRRNQADSYWIVIALRGTDTTAAAQHDISLFCTDGGLYSGSSTDFPSGPGVPVRAILGGEALDQARHLTPILCRVTSHHAVIRKIQVARAIDPDHRFQT